MMGAALVQVCCQTCKATFSARVADRKRGWGKYCSKSCKALKQTQRTGRAAPVQRYDDTPEGDWRRYLDETHPFSSEAFE